MKETQNNEDNANSETLTRWFWWSNWAPEKMEAWVEAKAAAGWSLVKADGWLLRFHFVRKEPHKVRVCADFPGNANDEYMSIFKDAGWQLVSGGVGWHIWQMEYSGTARPEAFTDLDSLIERATRTVAVLLGGLLGPVIALTIWGSRHYVLDSPIVKVAMVVLVALVIFLVIAIGATFRTIGKLKGRKSLTSE